MEVTKSDPATSYEAYSSCEARPPLRPASLAFSLPGSNLPDEACPPFEAISCFVTLIFRREHLEYSNTNLLFGIH